MANNAGVLGLVWRERLQNRHALLPEWLYRL